MLKTEDRYHLLVLAREYFSWWAEARPLQKGTSETVAHIFYNEVICRFMTPQSVVVDGGADDKN